MTTYIREDTNYPYHTTDHQITALHYLSKIHDNKNKHTEQQQYFITVLTTYPLDISF